MIPTLFGRLQTRLFLFVIIGIPVTLAFAFILAGWKWDYDIAMPFVLFLVTITALGLLLDPIYIFIQTTRWDRDWPFAYQFFFSWVEFGVVFALARAGLVPWLPVAIEGQTPPLVDFSSAVAIGLASLHFACVFIPSFLALLGPLQAFFIRWRFKGGQFGKL